MAKDDKELDPKDVKAPEKTTEEKIEIAREDLLRIVTTVESLQKTTEEQSREIAVLRDAASRQRLEAADQKHTPKDNRKRGHLKMFQNKIVHHWENKSRSAWVALNRMILKGATVVDEIVNAELVYLPENGQPPETEKVDYANFSKVTDLVYFRVNEDKAKEVKHDDGTTSIEGSWIIEFEKPELREKYGLVEIDITYVNP